VLQQLKAMAQADVARKALEEVEEKVRAFLPDAIPGAIQPVRPNDDSAWPELLAAAQQARLWVKPIRYPTVPKEEACMRLTLHADQTEEELERLREWVEAYQLKKMQVGN
jgi:7-keto-8-aminopelargonate synthetase-like enzyme